MRGLMMDRPLLVSSILDHAAERYGAVEMVSCTADAPAHRTTYAALRRRAKQLARALQDRLGVRPGERIATLAWNDHRHFELYYGIAGIGAVCHTINPRLFPEQIAYIINHAEDRHLFVDPMFLPLLEQLTPKLSTLERIVVLSDAAHMPASGLADVIDYESLIADLPDEFTWPEFDETTACGLCYTSGTTGNPKGALYHHRATVLHALTIVLPEVMGLSARDTVLPVVPMFHVSAWGLPYACPLVGARMVMPGPRLDGASLYQQFEREGVTFAAGVPTIWFGLLDHLRETGQRLTSLRRAVIGGAAPPPSMIEAFEEEYGVEVLHGWGMTEIGPVGAVCGMDPAMAAWPVQEQRRIKQKQGRALWSVELKIVDDQGRRLPHDGKSAGRVVRARPLDRFSVFPRRGGLARGVRWRGLVLDRRRRDHRPAWLHAHHRPGQGYGALRRRVDQLDRARECRGRPSGAGGSGGDRRAAPEMGRAAAAGCGAPAGGRGGQGRYPRVPGQQGGQVMVAGRCRVRRRAAAHGDRQDQKIRTAREVSGLRAADRVSLSASPCACRRKPRWRRARP